MYKSSLRHIHDPVLSSLKMEGIRLLFSDQHHLINHCDADEKFSLRYKINFLTHYLDEFEASNCM
jgi:hypothetical protein